MLSFIVRRLLQSLLVMLVVSLIAFSMFRYVGDPISGMVGQDTSEQDRAKLRAELGLNDPFVVQFAHFVEHAARGDFGVSYRERRPVSQLLAERFPATFELSMVSAILALVLGIPMGIYTALRRRGIVSQTIMGVSLLGISLPTFLVGMLLILFFGVELRWLPTFGRGDVVTLFGNWTTGLLTVSGLKALIMPSITLALFQLTLIMRLVRAEMLEVMRTDFIKFARARGLPERLINLRHALKNTLVPVITITGLQLGGVIAFSIITETVFQWPGVGLLFIQAIGNVDIPIMSAYLVLVAFIFVVINLIVDLLYFAVDPRLRVQSK
ncbi:ABC transporter permease [Bordetella sp. FB-8]|uniref:ABC transporter permease n=1 Tax=Bordetella sp. FB-8 TaxID=1159870 RepID=UPI0003675DA5|nr:ABC transporter permease [Bordetella sp. FB-8]